MTESLGSRLDYAVVVDEPMFAALLRETRRSLLAQRGVLLLAVFAIPFAFVAFGHDRRSSVVVAVLLVPLIGFGLSKGLRQVVRQAYPLGAEISTSFGDVAVDLRSPNLNIVQPYADFAEVTASADVVVFRGRTHRERSWIVPSALCPPEAREKVERARRAGVDLPAVDSAAFDRTVVADDGTAERLASAVYRRSRSTPRSVVSLLGLVLGAIVLAVLTGVWWWLLVLPVAVAEQVLAIRRTRASVALQFPPGSVSGARFTATTLVVQNAGALQEWQFSDFDRVWADDNTVVLRLRAQNRCFLGFPRGLFTEPDLERLRAGAN